MRFQRRERIGSFHVGHEAHIDLGDSAMRQDRFAAGAGVTADQTFDVHGRLRFEPFVRLLPRQIVDPMLHSELLLRLRFAPHFRHFFDHRFLFGAQRKRLRIIVDRDFVAVVGDERVERFHQMPRRAVHHRFERRMNVFGRTASPFFTARYQFQLDHAFRARGSP